MSITRALDRVCDGIQLLLISLYSIPRYMHKALEKTRLAISTYLISVVAWTCQENVQVSYYESFCGTTVRFVGLKTLCLFFGRVPTQMPVPATIWHPSSMLYIYRMNKTIDKWVYADESGPEDQGRWMCVYPLENKDLIELKKKMMNK